MVEFGLILSTCGRSWDPKETPSWDTILGYAKRAENLGFDSIWLMDHYLNPYQLKYYTMECLTVLSALSVELKKVRIGTCVLCNVFRHPSTLATIIASIDTISRGRVDVGIGSGWGRSEAEMLGLPWPKYSERVDLLRESLQLLGGLLAGGEVTFNGKHYRVNNAKIGPPSVQKPRPPLWVGGSSNAIQEIVARFGDAWLPEALSPRKLKEGVENIRRRAREFGRSPEEVKVGWAGGAERGIISKDRSEVEKDAEALFETNWWGKRVSEYFKTVDELPWMIGTPDECIGRIGALEKAGCQMVATGFKDFPSTNSLELYGKTVVSYFKHR